MSTTSPRLSKNGKRIGRPSKVKVAARRVKITSAIADEVLAELALGVNSLRKICLSKGFTASAFLQCKDADEELSKRYARAKAEGDDAAFDGLRELASELPPVSERGVDPGWVNWKRLQVDTLKWELSKRQPGKYGERMALTGEDGGPVQFAVKSILDEAAAIPAQRSNKLLEAPKEIDITNPTT